MLTAISAWAICSASGDEPDPLNGFDVTVGDLDAPWASATLRPEPQLGQHHFLKLSLVASGFRPFRQLSPGSAITQVISEKVC
jgi:hypothetical protein